MHRAKTTKTNDTVTLRQFHLFLENAKLPPRWKCSRKIYWSARFGCLRIEFFRFLYWFSTYIPPSLHIALTCSTYSPRRSTYSPRRSTYSPRTGAISNYIAPVRGIYVDLTIGILVGFYIYKKLQNIGYVNGIYIYIYRYIYIYIYVIIHLCLNIYHIILKI